MWSLAAWTCRCWRANAGPPLLVLATQRLRSQDAPMTQAARWATRSDTVRVQPSGQPVETRHAYPSPNSRRLLSILRPNVRAAGGTRRSSSSLSNVRHQHGKAAQVRSHRSSVEYRKWSLFPLPGILGLGPITRLGTQQAWHRGGTPVDSNQVPAVVHKEAVILPAPECDTESRSIIEVSLGRPTYVAVRWLHRKVQTRARQCSSSHTWNSVPNLRFGEECGLISRPPSGPLSGPQ